MARSSGHGGHLAALVGAATACLGTLLAMLHLVPGAFLTAFLADLGARRTDGLGRLACTAHGRGRELADLGAVDVERDAARHLLDVLLL